MSKENAEIILKVFRDEIELDDEDLSEKLEGENKGTRRNEKSKISKQMREQKLEWKYINKMINFCVECYNEYPYEILKNKSRRIKTLEEKNKRLNEWFDIKVEQAIKEEKKNLVDDRISELEERLASSNRVNQRLTKSTNELSEQVQILKDRPSREDFDAMRDRYMDLIGTKKPKEKENKSCSNNKSKKVKDDKYKKKCRQLEKDNAKLREEIVLLKDKMDYSSDDDSSSDSDSDDNITMTISD